MTIIASFSIPSLDYSYYHVNIAESVQSYKTSCGCRKPEKGQE